MKVHRASSAGRLKGTSTGWFQGRSQTLVAGGGYRFKTGGERIQGSRHDGEPLTITVISNGSVGSTTGGRGRAPTPLAKAVLRLGLADVTQGHDLERAPATAADSG